MFKRWKLLGLLTLTLVVLLALPLFLTAYYDYRYLCGFTGAGKGHREWVIGLRTHEWYEESFLEAFVRRERPDELAHEWHAYSVNGRSLYGTLLTRGCGRLPSAGEASVVMERYASYVSDEDVNYVYDIMLRGDEREQREVTTELVHRLIDASSK